MWCTGVCHVPGDASVPVFLSLPGTVDHGTAATVTTCVPPDCQHRGLRCPVSGEGGAGGRTPGESSDTQLSKCYQEVST